MSRSPLLCALVPVLALALSACGDQASPTTPGGGGGIVAAKATLAPTEGNDVSGTVTFRQDGDGVVVSVDLEGLTPGLHGFHIHEKGDCSAPDASSAGRHFNPTNQPHGAPSDEARHVGDLGNVEAGPEGKVFTTIRDTVIQLDGAYSIVGKAVVVHAGEDDLHSQPSGAAGPRVACGVIEAETATK